MMQAHNKGDQEESSYKEDVLRSLEDEGLRIEEALPTKREIPPVPQPEIGQRAYKDVKEDLRGEGLSKEAISKVAKMTLALVGPPLRGGLIVSAGVLLTLAALIGFLAMITSSPGGFFLSVVLLLIALLFFVFWLLHSWRKLA